MADITSKPCKESLYLHHRIHFNDSRYLGFGLSHQPIDHMTELMARQQWRHIHMPSCSYSRNLLLAFSIRLHFRSGSVLGARFDWIWSEPCRIFGFLCIFFFHKLDIYLLNEEIASYLLITVYFILSNCKVKFFLNFW